MGKIYTALGLMSGTSMDGVDVSIIRSDGETKFSRVFDKFFEYNNDIYNKLISIRDKICSYDDLTTFKDQIEMIERDLTIFQSYAAKKTMDLAKTKIDIVGFHGQTIYHNLDKKISKQLGNGKLLSQLLKTKVVYNFRQNDIKNGGQGAPLTPIFHSLISNLIFDKYKIKFPIYILNIGGISNITKLIIKDKFLTGEKILACDIGPGNCLIDEWIKKNSDKKFDKDGLTARMGVTDKLILNYALDNFSNNNFYEKSLDIKDFDIYFAKGLSLKDGASTITDFTAKLIADGINFLDKDNLNQNKNLIVCGGGRKNLYLLEMIKKYLKKTDINVIEKYNFDGDYIESQAFAYISIRSLKGMPISFPMTTRVKKPVSGGDIISNF